MARISIAGDNSVIVWVQPPRGHETAIAQTATGTPETPSDFAEAGKLACLKIEKLRLPTMDLAKSRVFYKEGDTEKTMRAVETPDEIIHALTQANLKRPPVLQQERWSSVKDVWAGLWKSHPHP